MNYVALTGNLGRDPDYREGTTNVCKFSIAVNEGDTTSWLPIVCFGKTADVCAKYLSKGSKVLVQGRIQTGSYEKNGEKAYTTDIVAKTVEFLSSKHNDGEQIGFTAMRSDDIPF